MIFQLSAAMVLIGVAIHGAALVNAHRLTAMLPAGALRKKWLGMTGLILLWKLPQSSAGTAGRPKCKSSRAWAAAGSGGAP